MEKLGNYNTSYRDRGTRVGTLVRWDPDRRWVRQPLEIYSNEEVLIGRNARSCQYEVYDPYVSNVHLRIYTVLFDQDAAGEVAPLVYAEDLSLNGTSLNNYPMASGKGGFLLSHGDVLWLTPDIPLRFNSAFHVNEECFSDLQKSEIQQFRAQYLVTPRVLGFGAYGRVFMAIKEGTGRQLACKIIDMRANPHQPEEQEERSSKFFKTKLPHPKLVALRKGAQEAKRLKDRRDRNRREAQILARLSHPNIAALEKVFQSDNSMYIFSELLTGGDLFSFIKYKGGYLEDLAAASITRQILFAIDYLHDRNIVHRDIKPDNILLTSLKDGCRVVLTDFGCAKMIDPGAKRTTTLVGTLEYCAPELCKSNSRGYTKAIDLWSLGCVTTILVAGCSPFDDEGNCVRYDIDMLEEDLLSMGASRTAVDFIYGLLTLDEAERMDVKQSLQHKWLTSPERKLELDHMYQRAIRGWKPVLPDESIIVDLKAPTKAANTTTTTTVVADTSCDNAVAGINQLQIHPTPSIDHVSESSYEVAPTQGLSSPSSVTLADAFNYGMRVIPHGNKLVAVPDPRSPVPILNEGSQNRKEAPSQPLSKRRRKSVVEGDHKQRNVDQDLTDEFLGAAMKMAEIKVREDIRLYSPQRAAALFPLRLEVESQDNDRHRAFGYSPSGPGEIYGPAKGYVYAQGPGGDDQKSEVVYEEVHNPFTGKKRRYIYGRDVDSIGVEI